MVKDLCTTQASAKKTTRRTSLNLVTIAVQVWLLTRQVGYSKVLVRMAMLSNGVKRLVRTLTSFGFIAMTQAQKDTPQKCPLTLNVNQEM